MSLELKSPLLASVSLTEEAAERFPQGDSVLCKVVSRERFHVVLEVVESYKGKNQREELKQVIGDVVRDLGYVGNQEVSDKVQSAICVAALIGSDYADRKLRARHHEEIQELQKRHAEQLKNARNEGEKRHWCRKMFQQLYSTPFYREERRENGEVYTAAYERMAEHTWIDVEDAWNKKPEHL